MIHDKLLSKVSRLRTQPLCPSNSNLAQHPAVSFIIYSRELDEMTNQPQYLTQEGMKNLQNRLSNLIEVRRPQVAERLRLALEEGGDLTENTEYEDAKNEQAFIE